MIVGQVLDKFLPITEPWIYSQIKGLDNLGIKSEIYCHKIKNPQNFQHNIIYSYKDLAQSKINFYKILGVLRNQDAATTYWNSIIKKRRPDLIHSHFGWAALKGIDLALKNNIPHIVTFYGSDVLSYPHLKNKFGEKYRKKPPLIFKNSKIIICTSIFLKSKLLSIGAPAKKIAVWRPGINLNLFKCKNNDFKNKNYTIISVGRFNEVKGQEYTIRALKIIISFFPSIKASFIGDGENLSNCMELSKKLGLKNNIEFLGKLNQEQVTEKMSESDIFVLASTRLSNNKTESLGMVLAEAGACGLPLIGSNVGGIPEIIINNKTGFLFQDKNYKQLAEIIIGLIKNPSLRKRLGKNSEIFSRTHFDTDEQNNKLSSYYKDAI